jgi:nitrogen regulatory protein PII
MKIITAMVQPFMLSKVTYVLEDIKDFPGMTVTEARGFGHKQSPGEQRAPHYDPFHPKSRIGTSGSSGSKLEWPCIRRG